MTGRTLRSLLVAAAAVVLVLVASGALDVRVAWRTSQADIFDLFKKSAEKDVAADGAAEPFWNESEQPPPPMALRGAPGSFADLAEQVSPAVVNIQTSKTVTGTGFPLPQPFEEFFGNPFGSPGRGRQFKVPSLGSGFVISADGYIVTNNHVVADVDSIKVALLDGVELDATVVGRDPKTDIALIRVETDRDLPFLPLGDSESVRPGDWVVAIGNPFGLGHTVTAGIVSGKARNIGQGPYDDFIQTDAAINPGNSGGPLVNLSGEVIGINTAINPRANTIGFAVPVNMAKGILPQLRATGHVTRGWLGVVIQAITPELAEQFELDDESGALVSRVLPDAPADKAGIERGDVIVEFDGEPVEEWRDLPRLVAGTGVGKSVKVVVLRAGKRKKMQVSIGELEEPEQVTRASTRGALAEFGLRIQNLTPEIAEQLGVEEGHGVVITAIEPGSGADAADLRRGDVILEVNRAEVKDVAELDERLEAAEDSALLLVRRGEATLYVAVKRAG